MATPAIAIEQCRVLTAEMAQISFSSIKTASDMLFEEKLDGEIAESLRKDENRVDKYEDALGTYLVKLNNSRLSDKDTQESSKLLHMIGDLERISDHSVNILESAEELYEKGIAFSDEAKKELRIISAAVEEITSLAHEAYIKNNIETAYRVEPLEQVIDDLKDTLRSNHIKRMQTGSCSIEAGFVWSDLLTNFERVSDHCSNIAGCVIEMSHSSLSLHKYLKDMKAERGEYRELYKAYSEKYSTNY
jgi:phosphate:Na+ symporter